MSVSNGQTANQTTFNNAYPSRTVDTSVAGVFSFLNTINPDSGNNITNAQRAINETFDAVGMTGEGDATRKNYSSNNILTNGDSHKVALGKIDAEFHESTGHAHSGAAGDGVPINAAHVVRGASNVNADLTTVETSLSVHISETDAHDAQSTNTASRIVLRDASGNFAAGTVTTETGLVSEGFIATEKADVATATNINDLATGTSLVCLTGSTATNLNGAVAGVDGQHLTVHNKSSAVVTVVHDSGSASAADRFDLPNDDNVEIGADSTAEFFYDSTASRWKIKSGSGGGAGGGLLVGTGSSGTPQSISAGTGISFAGDDPRQVWYIVGNGGPIDISANPQIVAGNVANQELILIGTSDTNTVLFEDGNGLSLNGDWYAENKSVLGLIWDADATLWVEMFRR